MKIFSALTIFILIAGIRYGRAQTPGSLDETFGRDGRVITDMGADDYSHALVIQPDGKLLVAGRIDNDSNYDFAVARYNTNGKLDNTFGKNGRVTTPVGDGDDKAMSMALQTDGKIVLAGYALKQSDDNDFAVVRYNANGTLDKTFGKEGKAITDIGNSDDYGEAIAIQPDGKIIVAGYSAGNAGVYFAMVRYKMNGMVDSSFGINGRVLSAINNNDYGSSIQLLPGGKILFAGSTYIGSKFAIALVKYNNDGSIDTTFGYGGSMTTSIGVAADYSYSTAIQSDGKILVAGSVDNGAGPAFGLVRYNANGMLDTTFGTEGKVMTSFGKGDAEGHSLALQRDGKIVVAGYTYDGRKDNFAMVRYSTNGEPDSEFGRNGRVITNFGSQDDQAYSVAIQSDGKIVLAGFSKNIYGVYDFAVARYIAAIREDKK